MARSLDPVGDYLGTVTVETEETRFLRSVPWVIDAGPQDPQLLIRALRGEAARVAELPVRPLFSLITPMYNTPPRLLRELILSVRLQAYPGWELILLDDGSPRQDHFEVAREWANRDSRIKLYLREENVGIGGARNDAIEQSIGDFLCILDHDDLLHPMALSTYARQISAKPDTNLVFSNEAQLDDATTRVYGFITKPPFDLFTLLRVNYVCHFTAIRRDLVMAARSDGRVFRSEYDGVEDHDLYLRVALTGQVRPVHVPLFLYYWRATPTSCSSSLDAKPEVPQRQSWLLDEMVPLAYPNARAQFSLPAARKGEVHLNIRLRSIEGRERPSLMIMVPFKDQPAMTLKCLESLESQRHELDVFVALIDNRSSEPGTISALEAWLEKPRKNSYEILPHDGPFNYARLHNRAIAERGDGKDLLLFLNNDVEIRSPDALQTMAMQLLADRTAGHVGIKLVYPDGREIQHGGIRILELIGGSGYNLMGYARTQREFVHDEHAVFGVTFACAMTRRETFLELGGLEEVIFPNGYGDVDMCARALEAGYRNYYFGTLMGIHHEGKSRGYCHEEPELAALHERHGKTFAYWRVRYLSHSMDHLWPMLAPALPAPPAPPPQIIEVPVVLPLPPKPVRYKVADKLNSGLKRLGPIHRAAKLAVLGSWAGMKRLRGQAPGQADHAGAIYRPRLFGRSRATRDH